MEVIRTGGGWSFGEEGGCFFPLAARHPEALRQFGGRDGFNYFSFEIFPELSKEDYENIECLGWWHSEHYIWNHLTVAD